ncbi:ABC transporter G family member 40 [Spatholobus suberectus]|nr:ABC transporter G family member 40 [Spatholobus suberectus]
MDGNFSRSISRSISRSSWKMEEVFASGRYSRRTSHVDEDEEALKWAAIEKLPTYDRLRTSIIQTFGEGDQQPGNKVLHKEVDVRKLDMNERQQIIDKIFKVAEEDNEKYLKKFRNRIDKVGIRLPTVEVRFQNLTVEADSYVGSRALPTLPNVALNIVESALGIFGISTAKRTKLTILKNASGIIKPSRMALLLGPPSSGKTTLLLALAGKLDTELRVKGEITYNGHKLNEFVPRKTSAYISQNDVHVGEMTVKETLDFSARCQGVGTRYDLLTELARREKEAGIFPEADVDLFMKATAMEGTESSLITDYTLKILGLDICKDTIVGDEMHRGVSGGQKKRVTTDYDNPRIKCLVIQIIMISYNEMVTSRKDQEQYWADKNRPYRYVTVTEFANKFKRFHVGMKLENELSVPFDKSSAHKAALVYSKNSVPTMDLFKACWDKEWLLIKRNSFVYIFKTVQICIIAIISATVFLRTEMHRNNEDDASLYIGAILFSMIMNMFNGFAELALTIGRLPVFYKHRDHLFHPAWTYTLPNFLLRIPISVFESLVWMLVTYYTIGFAPEASRFFKQLLLVFLIQQMAAGMFRVISGLCRTMIIANTGGALMLLLVFLLGGFILPKRKIPDWWVWAYWVSPLTYAFNALSVNEMFAPRWMHPNTSSNGTTTLGLSVLSNFDVYAKRGWYWIGAAALLGFTILYNVLFTLALMYLNPLGKKQAIISEEDANEMEASGDTNEEPRLVRPPQSNRDSMLRSLSTADGNNTREVAMQRMSSQANPNGLRKADSAHDSATGVAPKRGMILPFQPLAMSFDTVNYFVDMPALLLMKRGGQVIYSGPLGRNSHKIIEYFEAIPGVPKIKEMYNPATWMLEVSSVAAEVRLGMDFAEYYNSSSLFQRNKALVNELSTPPPGATDLYFPTKYSQSTWGQFKSCFWKQWLTYWRSPDYNLVRYFFTLACALMIGTVFWKIGKNKESSTDLTMIIGAMYAAVIFVGINNCQTVQPIVAVERTVFYRERAAGMYAPLPYAIAQVLAEVPYVFFQTVYYSLIVYAMVSFEWKVEKFFWFFFVSFFSFLYFTYYGMMTVSITPNHQVASIFAAAFYGLFNLFSGFFIPRPKIPKWWVWYYWICPVAWTVYGLIVSQYRDVEDHLTVPGSNQNFTVKGYIEDHYGFKPDFMGPVAAVLVSFTVFFAFVFSFCIKALNFQTR